MKTHKTPHAMTQRTRLGQLWEQLVQNARPGVVVALVSMPLAISLAVAAGATPAQGVVTAVWGGFVAGLLSSSHYNIEGPTGALSGVLSVFALRYGYEAFPLLAITSGLLSLLVVFFGLQKFILFLPSPVIHGFTLGVAVIIAVGQMNNALGLHPPHIPAHSDENMFVNAYHSFSAIGHTDLSTIVVFSTTFVFLAVTTKLMPKVPWSLVAVPVGCVLGYLSTTGEHDWLRLVTLGAKYDCTPAIAIAPAWPRRMPTFTDLLSSSVSVAFVAMLETLISARIADGMTQSYSEPRQEAFANSVANLACGASGGIPCTAALARTALNIKSGATSRISILINAVLVAIMGSTLLPYFEYYPMAVVAAQVVLVAVRMVELHHLTFMWKMDKTSFALTVLVALMCCAQDPSTGIVVGTVLGLLRFADAVSHGHAEVILQDTNLKVSSRLALNTLDKVAAQGAVPTSKGGCTSCCSATLQRLAFWCFRSNDLEEQAYGGVEMQSSYPISAPQEENLSNVVVYRIIGKLTYINAQRHQSRIRALKTTKGVHMVVLALRYMHYIDLDGVEAIGELIKELEAQPHPGEHRVKVALSGLQPPCEALICKTMWYQQKLSNRLVFPNYLQAVEALTGGASPECDSDPENGAASKAVW